MTYVLIEVWVYFESLEEGESNFVWLSGQIVYRGGDI